jgi:hypothetical protein
MLYKNSTPPIPCDLQMFRLMIMYSLCFMIDKAHGWWAFPNCKGGTWLPPHPMPFILALPYT